MDIQARSYLRGAPECQLLASRDSSHAGAPDLHMLGFRQLHAYRSHLQPVQAVSHLCCRLIFAVTRSASLTSSPCCWRGLRSGLSRGTGAWLRWVSCMPVCADNFGRSTGHQLRSFWCRLSALAVCAAGQHDGCQEALLYTCLLPASGVCVDMPGCPQSALQASPTACCSYLRLSGKAVCIPCARTESLTFA